MRMRQGMELAVNTLVVLILGLVLLGGGLALVYSIYDKAIDLPEEVAQRTEQQLFSMLLAGDQRIALLDDVQEAGRGDRATYAVAIQKELEGPEAECRVAEIALVTPDPASCTPSCPEGFFLDTPYSVPRYENEAFYVGIDVPEDAPRGEYVFMLRIDHRPPAGSPELYARAKLHAIVR